MKSHETTIGVAMIHDERRRQIEEENRSLEADVAYFDDVLARAAACFALPHDRRMFTGTSIVPVDWPWSQEWWKPDHDNRDHDLVRAGALIAAELDRRAGVRGADVVVEMVHRNAEPLPGTMRPEVQVNTPGRVSLLRPVPGDVVVIHVPDMTSVALEDLQLRVERALSGLQVRVMLVPEDSRAKVERPERHMVLIENDNGFPRRFRATCTCGWQGEQLSMAAQAEAQADAHVAAHRA